MAPSPALSSDQQAVAVAAAEELDAKFLSLTGSIGERAPALLRELRRLDEIADIRVLF